MLFEIRGMEREERTKFLLLGTMFGFIIGVYWMFTPVRDAFFGQLAHAHWLYYAKIVSVCAMIPLLFLYGKLVDRLDWKWMFYLLSIFFALSAVLFFILLHCSSYGLAAPASWIGKALGFAWYIWVDSFGALMVAFFWSFVSETTDPASAKRGYPIAVLGAQIGGIVGPLVSLIALRYGVPVTYILLLAAVGILIVGFMAWLIKYAVPERLMEGFKGRTFSTLQPRRTSFIEGLRLLFGNPYLLSIFAILALHELIMAFVEYRFKIGVLTKYTSLHDSARWLYVFGMLVNLSAMLIIVFGINKIVRTKGMGRALIILPIMSGLVVVSLWIFRDLWAIGFGLLVIKSLNYALNQPTKEQLYIPTSRSAKYKAKAWTDLFGMRISKASGAIANSLRTWIGIELFVGVGSIITLGMVGVWVVVALYLGRRHKVAVSDETSIC